MSFDKEVNSILEGFNVYPQAQTAPSTGPDIGMTTGEPQNTFPSKMETIKIKLPGKKIKKKLRRD